MLPRGLPRVASSAAQALKIPCVEITRQTLPNPQAHGSLWEEEEAGLEKGTLANAQVFAG